MIPDIQALTLAGIKACVICIEANDTRLALEQSDRLEAIYETLLGLSDEVVCNKK